MSEGEKATMTKEPNKYPSTISRRQFLKDAGLIVGGATVGSMALVNACSGTTQTVTQTKTVTQTVSGGSGSTVTVTKAAEAGSSIPGLITLNVNGKNYNVTVDNEDTLAFVVREKCLLPGTKIGCNRGECGTCTVLIDGKPFYSCLVLAIEAVGKKIETVEALGTPSKLSNLQQVFVNNHALQCGFCIPGFLMSSTALLRKNPKPTRQQAKEAVAGHFCYCGCMTRIIKSLTEAGGP